jgi:hypothetical protein
MGSQVMAAAAPSFVIPAQAGIHSRDRRGSFDDLRVWIPACAGMTGFAV